MGTPAYLAPEVIMTTKGQTYDGKVSLSVGFPEKSLLVFSLVLSGCRENLKNDLCVLICVQLEEKQGCGGIVARVTILEIFEFFLAISFCSVVTRTQPPFRSSPQI